MNQKSTLMGSDLIAERVDAAEKTRDLLNKGKIADAKLQLIFLCSDLKTDLSFEKCNEEMNQSFKNFEDKLSKLVTS